MSGVINIEEHNIKIEDIERAKKILDNAKPIALTKASVESKCKLVLSFESNGTFKGAVRIYDHSKDPGYGTCVEDLIAIAACTIKAFGSIPQELIDSVVVQ